MTAADARVGLPRRAATTALAAALAVTLVAVAAAASLPVHRNESLDTVFAERVALALTFEVTATELAQAAAATPPLGTPAMRVELLEAPAPASTGVAAEHWTYTVTVLERDAESVRGGEFAVELLWDGESVGAVSIVQNVSNPLVREGARVTFDLGPDRPQAPLFVVSARSESEAFAYRLRSVADGVPPEARWRGVGGAIEGETNPTLDARAGEAMRVVIENADNGFHNLRVLDASGAVVAGPTEDISSVGDEASLSWTPSAAGEFTYECQYHPDSMAGTIEVASS